MGFQIKLEEISCKKKEKRQGQNRLSQRDQTGNAHSEVKGTDDHACARSNGTVCDGTRCHRQQMFSCTSHHLISPGLGQASSVLLQH